MTVPAVLGGLALGAVLVFGGRWLLAKLRPAQEEQQRGLTSTRGRQELAEDISKRQQRGSPDAVLEAAQTGGETGVAVGTVVLGPAGAIIGLGLGTFVGALTEAIAHRSYAVIARDSLSAWLRDHDMPHGRSAVDATLFRNGLLGSRYLYRHRDGRLAIAVEGHDDAGVVVSLFGGPLQGPDAPFIPGHASGQVKQQIMGWADGQLDGPDQRNRNRAWTRAARRGDLHLIEARDARESWRTPGYVWFAEKWPRINTTPLASRAGWQRVEVTADNVDELAADFDRALGVSWS